MKFFKKQEPDLNVNLNQYILREYLCAYDGTNDLSSRIKYLSLGLHLFLAQGLPYYQFVEFHQRKRMRIIRIINILNATLCISGIYFIVDSNLWFRHGTQIRIDPFFTVGLILLLLPLIVLGYTKGIRKSLMHSKKALEIPQFIKELQVVKLDNESSFAHMAEKLLKGDFHDEYFLAKEVISMESLSKDDFHTEMTPDRPNDSSVAHRSENEETKVLVDLQVQGVQVISNNHNDLVDDEDGQERNVKDEKISSEHIFINELIEISNQPNKFNEFPMSEVIKHFLIMCCPACKDEIPQMSQTDFLRFLRAAFLYHPLGDKIELHLYSKMITREIFHQFMVKSISDLKLRKVGIADKYIPLLSEHFKGYDFKETKLNFRTTDDYRLERVRNDYKSDLQRLQSLQRSGNK
ncbi:hypothetical protein [Dyadobacter sediminis]|uniref:hypothetical protein n=1 Tax=Dyadobacter sediminis TaxID=1493691 RepID=UPI001668ED59|nr:hypothetical protein [Dyadobacter sediminis]GGB87807.1 hypothetical protein GCM10011325_14220 [Dyadobacter sediminis]